MKTKLPPASRLLAPPVLADRLGIRCTPEELHRWDTASRPGPVILSEWARTVLNEKAASIHDTRREFAAPKSEDIEDRALAICRRLRITRRDLSRITLAAGLDAIEAKLAAAGEITFPLALEVSNQPQAIPVPIRVSAYHLEGMTLAAMCGFGGGTADGWASRTLSLSRIPKPARPYSFPDRPTGHTVTVTLPRERFDELAARATRDCLPLREWMHAALVGASRKYRATLDTRPAKPAAPAGDCVVSLASRSGGARITMNFDRQLTDRMDEHATATRTPLREVIALAAAGDQTAAHCIAGTWYGTHGHSLTMDLDRAQLAGITTRAQQAGLPVPEFVRLALKEAPESRPALVAENVLPFFTGHFREATSTRNPQGGLES